MAMNPIKPATAEELLLHAQQLLQMAIPMLQAQRMAAPSSPESMKVENETLSVAEAAKYLRVSEWAIYDLVKTKKIPCFRVKSRIFLRKREIETWIAGGGMEA